MQAVTELIGLRYFIYFFLAFLLPKQEKIDWKSRIKLKKIIK